MPELNSKYGTCFHCGTPLNPVWFQEVEFVNNGYGGMCKTGRTRKAVDYLFCPCCLRKTPVDDSFDEPWS